MKTIRLPPRPEFTFEDRTPDGRPLVRLVGETYQRVGVVTDPDAVEALCKLFDRAQRRPRGK